MTDDAHLLRQYCEVRSETAFAELVGRHLGLVYHCALRHLGGDAHLAQDVAQIVFVLLAEKARALLGHPSLAGWLYATTHFKASEALRAERRRKLREEAAVAMREDLAESAPAAEQDQTRAILDEIILELNKRDREAILLRFFEGQAYAEIAARIALTEKAAHKRVERALAQLRRSLGRRGITSGAAALGAILSDQAVLGAPAGLAARITGAAMASSGPAAALGALELMTATKMTTSIAIFAGILAVGLVVHERTDLRRTAVALAVSQQECIVLTDQFRQLGQKVHTLEAYQIASQSSPPFIGFELPATSGDAGSRGGTGGRGLPKDVNGTVSATVLNEDPQVHEALGSLVAWNNAHFFGPLLQSVGLSQAQVQRAEYLIGQQVAFGGFGPDPLSFKTDPRLPQEIEIELQQTIGDAGIAVANTYLITRFVTDELAGSLYDSDSPLTAQQAAQLTQVLVSTNQNNKLGAGWYIPQNTDWSAALAQAGQFLSPAQFAQLKNLATGRFGSTAP